jgi:acetoin utilization protein AcuA
MQDPRQEEIQLTAPMGAVTIRSFCSAEEIRQTMFNPQFSSHAQYRSLYTRRQSLEDNAEQPDTNVTLALTDGNLIVGFGVLAYPEAGERWAELEPQIMMEVKAIETCRVWRSQGLAKGILSMLLHHPFVEDKIVYMVGYSWTWDLDGSKKTAQQYRRMLIRLFEPFGFVEYQTNEPNICLKPENVFMGRVGKNVSSAVQDDFKWLRFGMRP